MKNIFKRIAMILLVFNLITMPLFGCSTEPDKEIEGVTFEDATFVYSKTTEHTLLVTGDLPDGVTATYENNVHTDRGIYQATCTLSGKGYITKTLKANMTIKYSDFGAYDEKSYPKWYQDTQNFNEYELAGTFADGSESKSFISQTKVGINSQFNSTKEQVDSYMINELDATIEKDPIQNQDGYLVLENKTVGNKIIHLNITPACTKEEFLQADYIEFYMFYHANKNDKYDPNEIYLYVGNYQLYTCDELTWVQVKIPLNIYESAQTSLMSEVNGKDEFYDYLMQGNSFINTKVNLRHLSGEDTFYKIYFTDIKLKVEKPDAGQKNGNFTKLNQTKYYEQNGKTLLTNIYTRYSPIYNDGIVEYDGYDGVIKKDLPVSRAQGNKNTLLNIMYVQAKPTKTYKQIAKYDALAITMRIDSQNPNPYIAFINIPSATSSDEKTIARFEANKWVTIEIPVEYLLKMYPGLINSSIYYTPANSYVWYNTSQSLFNISYEIVENGATLRAGNVYSSRIDKGGATKFVDGVSNGNEYSPVMQGNWLHYPMSLYIRSMTLVKKS